MDRKTLLAITLCFLIFIGWQKFYIEPLTQQSRQAEQLKKQAAQKAAATPGTASSSQGIQNSAPPTIGKQAAKKEVPLQTKEFDFGNSIFTASNGPSFIESWTLKDFTTTTEKDAPKVNLKWVINKDRAVLLAFDRSDYAYVTSVRGQLKETPNGLEWFYEDQNLKITRTLNRTPQDVYLDGNIQVTFKADRPSYAFLSLGAAGLEDDPEAMDRSLVFYANDEIEMLPVRDDIELAEVPSGVKWIGAMNRYFLLALIPQGPVAPRGLVQPSGTRSGRVNMVYPISSNTISIPFKVYFGAKELDRLRSVEPTLGTAVDFGWFSFIGYGMLWIMKWFYGMVQNYGIAIILMTILLKILLYPLTYKSAKSMRKMAELQPEIQKLKEKHGDDREAMNREMMMMMKTKGYNPMAGCMPILIQMPLFFALYRVLYSSVELYQEPFAFWLQDLSAKDPYYITPVLMIGVMFVQQKLTPMPTADPMQKRIMQLMPIMFGAFMLTVPAGLSLYMLVNIGVSIIQQMAMNKKLGPAPQVAMPSLKAK